MISAIIQAAAHRRDLSLSDSDGVTGSLSTTATEEWMDYVDQSSSNRDYLVAHGSRSQESSNMSRSERKRRPRWNIGEYSISGES